MTPLLRTCEDDTCPISLPRSQEDEDVEGEEAGEPYVAFSSDVVSDQQTESDMKQLENKHKMSLQQMKEQILGSVRPLTSLINAPYITDVLPVRQLI